jgi:di/tricarboxylate transporter
MTPAQWILITLLILMLATMASERFRLEVVAATGLTLAFLLGLVPGQSVFSGFAHPAVITVAEILILVGALQASHIMDRVSVAMTRYLRGPRSLLSGIICLGAGLSMFMNNIGALALMIPLTMSVCSHAGIPPKRMLMPLSFATLLGGTCSLIGTPANLIVSDVLAAERGSGFFFFDFAAVGIPATLAGLAAIIIIAPLLFRSATNKGESLDQAHFSNTLLITEARIPKGSDWIGRLLPEIDAELEGSVGGVFRDAAHVFGRRESIALQEGDILFLEGNHRKVQVAETKGSIAVRRNKSGLGARRLDAVVVPQSVVLGSRLSTLAGFESSNIQIEAVTSLRKRLEGRFSDLQLAIGDVLHLTGPSDVTRKIAEEHGLLVLSADLASHKDSPGRFVGLGFLAAVLVTATGILRPELAFGATIVALALLGKIDIPDTLRNINWPILIMLAAMIPIGAAVETTGTAQAIANLVLGIMPGASQLAIYTGIVLCAVIITPFVNNASAAIVLAPIALEIAHTSGIPLEGALLAVAIGVSLDFLTPFGHHNNTIIMGVGGYRFVDFPRLGMPLLLVIAVPVILALHWLNA